MDVMFIQADAQPVIIWFIVAETWQKSGGEAWQLIEPVDGFHPNQVNT